MGNARTTRRDRPPMSRRGLCLCCLAAPALAAGGGWPSPRQAFAQARGIVDTIMSEAARAPIATHRVREGFAVLEGSGGNILVLTGPDGALLVDAGIAASRPQLTAALAGLGAGPVRQLINTHWHFDHADGNEWLHAAGAAILAHENTRRRLSAAQRVEDWNHDFPASPAGALPAEVFAGERIVRFGGATARLRHYGPAHTDGDISVHFADADVLHAGDTYWNGVYPFIDYSTGGSIDGMIRAAEANLDLASESTIVVPGHGPPVSDRAGLREYRDMLVAVRAGVAALKRQGRSLEEVIAARPTAAYDAKWGGFVVAPALFTRLVFMGV
ncbi:MAG: MBL fold metallo-hydrolase [Acetobacteraceae bacterium]|nr:MBL fold metallo-hydrolase [Acetobacteraceae bacterium]